MANEEKGMEKSSVDVTKELIESKKKKAKGRGITFRPYIDDLRTRLSVVQEKRQKILTTPGNEKALARQRAMGKLTARERVNLLLDKGTFHEFGLWAESQVKAMGMEAYYTPADGVVCGVGEVDGRKVAVYSTDYTVLAGSMGEGHMIKISNLYRLASNAKIPIVQFVDSSGARLHEAAPMLGGAFDWYQLQCVNSGFIPQIAVICGGCAAGQAYGPNLTDLVIMTRRPGSSLWLGGPRATMAVTTAEDISGIGGADYHMRHSGSVHFATDTDEEAVELTKRLLSYLPSNCDEKPPYKVSTDDPYRQEERLLDILPRDPRRSYDMHEIVELIVDKGSFLEVHKEFGRSAIVGFCRFDGYVCGLYAGNPYYIAGSLELDACDKITRFFTFCDCFNIPFLYLLDTPAILVGDEWEKKGVVRHGSKLLYTTNTATVPRICVLVRKGYGGALPIFLSKSRATDFTYAWPTGEYAPMGPDAAVSIIYNREIAALPTSEERLAFAEQKKREYFERYCDPLELAPNMRYDFFDDVIDPRCTREYIIKSLRIAKNFKRRITMDFPKKKHGNPPV
jgi:propionyl-CoA carboxylase beta chain